MRFSTVDEDAVQIALPSEATAARKVQDSVAIHAALGPVAIETRLKELDREIAAQQAVREPHVALLFGAFGHDGLSLRRRFLCSMAGAGLLAGLTAALWPVAFRSRQRHTMHEIQQEREALFKLKHELP